ncbi:MAG: tetratricopeptide repeat protein [Scytolyngbya sp. HA4215-MV1]|nr:tetratricopeptide repeat protein [Scytolyngbya sp. HA4215-MV1]
MLICCLFLMAQPTAMAAGGSLIPLSPLPAIAVREALVFPDYLQRSQIIHHYEAQVRQSPDSFLLLRLLAAQYLRRFRETNDVEDLLRAEQAARRSLTLQPRGNAAAALLLASTLLSQHRFQEALQVANEAQQAAPDSVEVAALRASIQMELGNYEAAQQLLQTHATDNPGRGAVAARYLELTGHLDSARQAIDVAMQEMDAFYTNPAEVRAWFHVRAGDLAFAAGELSQAEHRYREALALYPPNVAALTGLARLYAAQHRWQEALAAANQGIDRVPLVENLGYKADAQRALGDAAGAAATEDLIEVVGRLSQIKGIYDRALAVYYTEHGIRLPEALAIARREVAGRDDIYAEDTLAWAAAANGHWQEAQQASQKAIRYGTKDALLQFHRGMIALHEGERAEASQRLQQALRLNPSFHPQYAAEARQTLATLSDSHSENR